MTLVLKDRVKEQTTTTGTGTVTLGGAVSGFESFSAVGNGNTTYYAIVHQTADEWEVGLGTYTAAGTLLSRDTILESTNSDAAVNFSAGTKDVFVTYPSDKAIYADGSGNVGIGTSSPAVPLHISSATPSIRLTDTDDNSDANVGAAAGGLLVLDADINNEAAGTAILFRVDGGSEKMRINSSGNVGIGTTVPAARLHSSVGTSSGAALAGGVNVAGFFEASIVAGLQLSSGTGSPAYFFMGDAADVDAFRIQAGNGFTQIAASGASDYMRFDAGGFTERMRITSSGNVGIGTSSPLTKLVTVGTLMATSQAFVGSVADTSYSGGIINLSNSSRSIGITSDPTNAGAGSLLNFSVDGTERMRINSSGNVGIGTTAPGTKLEISTSGVATLRINDSSSTTRRVDLSNSGGIALLTARNGATNTGFYVQGGVDSSKYVRFFENLTQFFTSDTERMRIDSSGNVGIGTTSPSQKLEVAGNILATGGSISIGTGGLYQAGSIYSDANWGMIFRAKQASPSQAEFRWANSVDTERMRIDSSGKVGIGTTAPASALTVSDGTASGLTPFSGTELFLDSSGDNYLQFGSGTSSSPAIYFGDSADGDVGGIIYAHASNAMSFRTNAAERMRISSSGNVGIGTSSPDSGTPLHVQESSASLGANPAASALLVERAGTVAMTLGTANTGTASIFFGDPENLTGGRVAYDNSNNALQFWANAAERMRINSSGLVGIGTTAPAEKLDVNGNIRIQGGSPRLKFYETDNATKTWQLGLGAGNFLLVDDLASTIPVFVNQGAPDNSLRILSSGNVGIGTASPTAELDIESTSPEIHLNDSDGVLGGAVTSRMIFQASGSTQGIVGLGTSGGAMAVTNNQGSLLLQADTNNAQASSYISFTVDNAAKMRITSSGNVGIGTTAPAKQLEITKSARATITSLTDGATITPDFDAAQNFTVTLGGNRTLANPSNIDPGQTGSIFVVQDATGGRTLSFGSYWKFAGGTAPTLSTGASATDRIDYVVQTSTAIHAVASLNLS